MCYWPLVGSPVFTLWKFLLLNNFRRPMWLQKLHTRNFFYNKYLLCYSIVYLYTVVTSSFTQECFSCSTMSIRQYFKLRDGLPGGLVQLCNLEHFHTLALLHWLRPIHVCLCIHGSLKYRWPTTTPFLFLFFLMQMTCLCTRLWVLKFFRSSVAPTKIFRHEI